MGVFSMHFIGMMAFHIGSPLTYHPFLLFVSLFAAIIASFASFYILQVEFVTKAKVVLSGFIIGTGIVSMHYIGMMAITEPVNLQFNSYYFILSILIAMIFSSFALKFFFEIKETNASVGQKVVSAVILGLGISLMHYTGMKATFYSQHSHTDSVTGIHPFTLAVVVSITVLIIMIIATFLSFLDLRTLNAERRFMVKVKESEERFRRLVELSPEAIVVLCNEKITFINEACLIMINGFSKSDLIGKSITEFVHPSFKDIVRERTQNTKPGFKAKPMELRIITPVGTVLEVEVTGVGIEFEGKSAIQLVLRDITLQKKTGRELEENRQRYRSLFQNNPDGVYSMDHNGNLMDINPSLEGILGYSIEELLTMSFHVVVDPNHLEMTNANFIKALGGKPENYETVGIRKNGKRIPLHITNIPIIVDDQVIGVYGIAKDISKEKEALNLLGENEEKYRSLFEYNLDAVVEIDMHGYFKNANKMTEKLTGFSKNELLTLSFPTLIANDLDRVNEFFTTVIGGNPVNFEHTIKNKNGHLVEVDINAVPKRKQGKIDGIFAIVRDVTEKKQAQKKIVEQAFTDQLTGLPNRHWFYKNLKEVVKRTKEQEQMIAILLVDFDDFKRINDLLGHYGGDLFLKQVSDKIRACLRKKDHISRLGGDEFIIVLEDVTEEDIRQLADQILKEMKQPVLLLGQEIVITLSIGISMQSTCTSDEETIIRQADVAMYLAKEKGKNNYQFFTDDLNKRVTKKLQLEKALHNALEQEEFQLYYQPQVDLRTGVLVGFEALIRWNSPSGLVSPMDFIPIAEETGLILPIGEWVIKEACRQIKAWENESHLKVPVSVNVSARQFTDVDFSKKVTKMLEEEKVDPHYLELEITESVMMNIEESSLLIEELKAVGVKIAIDDFGAGYSSLNVIKNVEIDTLKIDKSLIDEVLSNRRNMFILASIIDVGKKP
ncbi:PAS domain S-box protein [Paenisporosarcina macmurdoensis]|uniref:PAS domain S-box protein n=1 Tax=Paenisporosarcina macmurdoensis TaxID=212659 RepID=A0ABW1L715_9BACL